MPDPSRPSAELPLRSSRPAPDTVVVYAAGEVDILTAPTLDAEITRQLTAATRILILDLTGITFFSSSGLAVLVRTANATGERGVRLILAATGRPVLRPLQVTNTVKIFTIHDSVEAALASCG